jgi:hypothetical protein
MWQISTKDHGNPEAEAAGYSEGGSERGLVPVLAVG